MENEYYYNQVPSIGGSFSYGWRTMFGKSFLILFVAVIIMGLLNGPSAGLKFNDHSSLFTGLILLPAALFGLAYAFLFLPVIKYGRDLMFLHAMRGEEAEIKTLFEGFRKNYLNIILANLIVLALVAVGTIMLIVPGIIVLCRLIFVPYLVMDKNLEAMKAIEKSWQMSRGHGWEIFGMLILSFFIAIGGLIVFFVGIIFARMWRHSAFATFYQSVLNQSEDDNPIPILGVNEQ
ncbi:DUF975 family protein [Maribellus sp. YY47]|uniref:DUF975 family protein n=1 Tax=Maribellus sp. YY47 TaxID=2929486 RepID=UPI0020013089|nr:DUF975 family protein [Maribellus sp. YY47]MCK3686060.1 DUF975 family protein [Maribellus sp. YY47]